MPATSPSIYLGVCGKFHAFSLASEFAKMGRLGGLYAANQNLKPPGAVPAELYHNRWDLKVWRLLAARSPISIGHQLEREYRIFDRWLLRSLKKLSGGIFHGWNSHAPNTLRELDPAKWVRCIERSCPHNQFQHDLLLEESTRLDLPYRKNIDDLQSAIQELYDADVIVAPSKYSAASYEDPVLKRKVRVNALGANLPFRPRTTGGGPRPLRVLLVGNAFLRKGTHYLIEAFKQIPEADAELWIRGEVPAGYARRIVDSRVRIFPAVSLERLHQLYREATVFCLPSIDEGFGMVALEAISHGLPLVYTDHCGVGDILPPEVGCRVPIRSPEALASAIDQVRGWTADDFLRFDLAREKILADNTWEKCAERMVSSVYVP